MHANDISKYIYFNVLGVISVNTTPTFRPMEHRGGLFNYTRGAERGSRSALIVVANAFIWPLARLCQIKNVLTCVKN